jgi:cobalt-zinc-cadmium efflux system protein
MTSGLDGAAMPDAHDHDDHTGHDHDDHAGHDHDDHTGHDHDDHTGHDHDDHDGHDHDDHAGHDHGAHSHAHDLRESSRKNLLISLVLISTYMVAEIVGGIVSGSLALLADAGHMATDAGAIALALGAMWIAQREASPERTFGYYRVEVIAALLNVIALWLIVAWIFFEAYHRFTVEETHIDGGPVLIVGTGGLIVNIIAAFILHRSSGHSLNAEGAFQHVLADLLGSVGVIVAAVLILGFGWHAADPIISMVIGLLILFASRGLLLQVFHVLIEGTPEHIDVYELCNDIEEVEGVTLIHDVHVWTITSQSESFSAHVLIDPNHDGDVDAMITEMQDIAHDRYGIEHVTIQVESSLDGCTEDHHVGHLMHRSATEREERSLLALFAR